MKKKDQKELYELILEDWEYESKLKVVSYHWLLACLNHPDKEAKNDRYLAD